MDVRAHSRKRVQYNLCPVDSHVASIVGSNPTLDQTVIPYSLVAGSAAHLDRPFMYHTWPTAVSPRQHVHKRGHICTEAVDETILQLNRDVLELVRQKNRSTKRAREECNPLKEMLDTFLFWADQ